MAGIYYNTFSNNYVFWLMYIKNIFNNNYKFYILFDGWSKQHIKKQI